MPLHSIEQADVEFCYEIAADFGQYLNWARKNGMQEVKVLEEYEDGRGKRVKFRAKPPLGPDLDNELVSPHHPFCHCVIAAPLVISSFDLLVIPWTISTTTGKGIPLSALQPPH